MRWCPVLEVSVALSIVGSRVRARGMGVYVMSLLDHCTVVEEETGTTTGRMHVNRALVQVGSREWNFTSLCQRRQRVMRVPGGRSKVNGSSVRHSLACPELTGRDSRTFRQLHARLERRSWAADIVSCRFRGWSSIHPLQSLVSRLKFRSQTW